jgi:hypothetical protein
MDTDGFASVYPSFREATEARMQLLSSSASVREARTKAEVEFRSREVSANWRNWKVGLGDYSLSRIADIVPPHWEAGARYAAQIIPAYGEAALDEIRYAAEFEDFLRECAWVVADRTYQRKLQPYDSLLADKIDRAVANFHQLVRTEVAAEVARLVLEAWQRHAANLDIEVPSVPAPERTDPPNDDHAPIAVEASVQDCSAQELALEREARLQAFLGANGATIAAVSDAAAVHKPEMQSWRHGRLSAKSKMAQRIESVLSGETPLKANGAVPAEPSVE